jgi:phosphoglycolate phosphatase-like HAD superfamily hydrolase
MKNVIFDLDGTLALIDKRRSISLLKNGKMDWDVFFDPNNIDLDQPNDAVIAMAKTLKDAGNRIIILSGRSKATKDATKIWLNKFGVPFDILKMRPTSSDFKFMPDDKLKQMWLDQLFTNKDDILCVFDDRQKVVDMWRANGLTCMQVAPGDF